MATIANSSPPNVGSPATEDSEAPENEQQPTGPSLSFSLAEDPNRKDQLFSIRKLPPPPSTQKPYRPSEKQLLREGKLGESEISARLHKVEFGTFQGETACLVVVQVDFAPKKKGWFRFRAALVEIEFQEEGNGEKNEDENEDDDDDEEGPLVLQYYPNLIRGHIQTAVEKYGITIAANIPAPVSVGGVSGSWSVSAPREGQHLVHGRLVGSPERKVKWTMNENESSKSGIYEQPMFAAIVRYREEQGFVMTLGMKATTYGGLAVMGKGGSRIKFTKGKKQEERGKGSEGEQTLPGLVGGSIASGGKTWTAEKDFETSYRQLEEVDLEDMTGMKVKLLSEQGPGGGEGKDTVVILDAEVDAALSE